MIVSKTPWGLVAAFVLFAVVGITVAILWPNPASITYAFVSVAGAAMVFWRRHVTG